MYLDEVVLRKIKRAEQLASRRQVAYTSDPEPDDDNASMVEGRTRNIKQERAARAGGRSRNEDEMEED